MIHNMHACTQTHREKQKHPTSVTVKLLENSENPFIVHFTITQNRQQTDNIFHISKFTNPHAKDFLVHLQCSFYGFNTIYSSWIEYNAVAIFLYIFFFFFLFNDSVLVVYLVARLLLVLLLFLLLHGLRWSDADIHCFFFLPCFCYVARSWRC